MVSRTRRVTTSRHSLLGRHILTLAMTKPNRPKTLRAPRKPAHPLPETLCFEHYRPTDTNTLAARTK